jgi:hypothetical protein
MAGLALTGCAPGLDPRGHAEALLVEACLRLLRPRLFKAVA